LTEPLLKRAARWKYAAKKLHRKRVEKPQDENAEATARIGE
jgi:hypothetical protein